MSLFRILFSFFVGFEVLYFVWIIMKFWCLFYLIRIDSQVLFLFLSVNFIVFFMRFWLIESRIASSFIAFLCCGFTLKFSGYGVLMWFDSSWVEFSDGSWFGVVGIFFFLGGSFGFWCVKLDDHLYQRWSFWWFMLVTTAYFSF